MMKEYDDINNHCLIKLLIQVVSFVFKIFLPDTARYYLLQYRVQ